MRKTIRAVLVFAALLSPAARAADVVTYHNDNARTGGNPSETFLSPGNVAAATFGLRFSHAVDGYVYAQPLYLSNVPIPGKGVHNVLYVATEHDSVYAFDAADATGPNAAPLWQTTFLANPNPNTTVTTVSSGDVSCGDLVPEIGITATPVIDAATGAIYVEAKTKEVTSLTTSFVHRLHALDVATGSEKFGGPVRIQATVPGTGDGSVGGVLTFDPLRQHCRPGLLLSQGFVYLAFASHCDIGLYHGWVLGYDASTLAQASVYCATADGGLGGVWMAGGGLAADSAGNAYFQTGNGTFDQDTLGRDYRDSLLKLTPGLALTDFFTPYNEAALNGADDDLGSGGVLILPDQPGAHTHLSVSAGKGGTIYLADRDNLGQFNPVFDGVVQSLPGAIAGSFGTPAYFNSSIYYGESYYSGGYLKAFSLTNGFLSTTPTSQSARFFPFPGSTPSVSSNGILNGIVWAIENANPAILRAYDATNLATELYDSNQAGARDHPGPAVKFAVPTVVNGKVYVGTQYGFSAYGCLPDTAPVVSAPGTVASAVSGLVASVPSVAGSTFAWTISGGTIDSGQGTNQITFTSGSPGVLELAVVETLFAGCPSVPGRASVTVIPAGTILKYFTIAPCRLVDTRRPVGTWGGPALSSGSVRSFPVAGQCGVPANALAISANLTAVLPAAARDLRVFPQGTPAPSASAINFSAGRTRANNAIFSLDGSPLGGVAVQCDMPAGTTHMLLDIGGYFRFVSN
jgi:hypothetical protein